MTATARELLEKADRAAASGNLREAASSLERALGLQDGDLGLWMKLAAVKRAVGDVNGALESVHRALAIAPLDFMALLMRASLLDRLNDPDANLAWSHALAQRPSGELPPQVASVVVDAQRRVAEWTDVREAEAKAAMANAEAEADDEQRARMARFRSNALRKTRHYHSEPTEFHYPGLVEREFHPRRLFPWLKELEAATDMLTAELTSVMAGERAELVPYIQYDEHLPLEQWRSLNKNANWTAIHLLQNGDVVEANARLCPGTMQLLKRIPQPQIPGASPNAMFSLLAPRTAIPPHVGVNNARLVCHLPLVIPDGCWFRVGGETRYWKRGEAFVFDDTMEHEALNPTDELRVVFILDVWHPELSDPERRAVAALVGTSAIESGGL